MADVLYAIKDNNTTRITNIIHEGYHDIVKLRGLKCFAPVKD